MYKIWIHHFPPESNQQSAESCAAGESHLKHLKMQQTADKVMVSVYWDAYGIIHIDHPEKRKSVNSDYYIELLVFLMDKILKNNHTCEEKKSSFIRTMHRAKVNENNGQIERVRLQSASSPTIFSRSRLQRLLAIL